MYLHHQCRGHWGDRGDLTSPRNLRDRKINRKKNGQSSLPINYNNAPWNQNPNPDSLFIAEAVAYEWGVNGGVMKYTYPSDKRPDTSEDVLSLGFISPSFDAVLVRVDSDPKMNNDYLQLEIVSTHSLWKKA